ncbi:hypothetical protein, partial [Bacteroides stercoris]|uniref:hypothetical protein n=1 Tax=Bacteroides stercoris TaxID=46506 RepID=UPI0034A27F75
GHYTYPMVAQFSTGILAHFSISIYTSIPNTYFIYPNFAVFLRVLCIFVTQVLQECNIRLLPLQ